jgi:hypothetical protein
MFVNLGFFIFFKFIFYLFLFYYFFNLINLIKIFFVTLGHYLTPSCVSFDGGQVFVGAAAVKGRTNNFANTIYGNPF